MKLLFPLNKTDTTPQILRMHAGTHTRTYGKYRKRTGKGQEKDTDRPQETTRQAGRPASLADAHDVEIGA